MLDHGTAAPPFDLPDQNGEMISLESLLGKWTLLWWYPKAGTPGCTVEGRELSSRIGDFSAAGCNIVGISFDTVSDNLAWAENQGFAFRLLSDEDHAIGRLYEVEREPDDQYAAFPLRVSYLVDPEGVIRKTFAVTGVADHADSVLEALSALRSS
ncbi:MAG TPA: peroxiredoxin [Acidimicrobiales bacterium]